MEFDLPQSLRDLGHEPAVRAADLAVPTMLARVHRRRAARRTAVGTTVACVAVAVAAVGVTIAGHRAPDVAPAVPTPSTSATPTVGPVPTTTATAEVAPLPAGDPTLPFGACGSLVGSAPAAPVTDRYVTWLGPDDSGPGDGSTDVALGAPLRVLASTDPVEWSGGAVAAVPWAGPRFAVVADGVVVGLSDMYRGTDEGIEMVTAPAPAFIGAIDLTVCGGDTAVPTGHPLPAGQYELYAVTPVTEVGPYGDGSLTQAIADGSVSLDDLVAGAAAQHVTSVSEPMSFTVVESTEPFVPPVEPAERDVTGSLEEGVQNLVCGAPAPEPTDLGGLVGLQHTLTGGTVTAGQPLAVDAMVEWRGAGRLRTGVFARARAVAVQDGVIVGGSVWEGDQSYFVYDLGLGSRVAIDNEVPLSACTADGALGEDPLPSGDYQVFVYADLVIWDVRASGPVDDYTGDAYLQTSTIAAPVAVTLR